MERKIPCSRASVRASISSSASSTTVLSEPSEPLPMIVYLMGPPKLASYCQLRILVQALHRKIRRRSKFYVSGFMDTRGRSTRYNSYGRLTGLSPTAGAGPRGDSRWDRLEPSRASCSRRGDSSHRRGSSVRTTGRLSGSAARSLRSPGRASSPARSGSDRRCAPRPARSRSMSPAAGEAGELRTDRPGDDRRPTDGLLDNSPTTRARSAARRRQTRRVSLLRRKPVLYNDPRKPIRRIAHG